MSRHFLAGAAALAAAPGPYVLADDDYDPFTQPPPPVEVIDESKVPRMPKGVNQLLAGWWMTPKESAERNEKIRKLTPEIVEQLRADYLAKLDTRDLFKRNDALYVSALILKKVNQFDAEGKAYNREILIDTILEKLRSDHPSEVMENFDWLDGTRDWKIHAYIASFLDSEYEPVRRAAAKALPATSPLPEGRANVDSKEKEPAHRDPPRVQNPEAPGDAATESHTWQMIGLGVFLIGLVTVLCGAKFRRKEP